MLATVWVAAPAPFVKGNSRAEALPAAGEPSAPVRCSRHTPDVALEASEDRSSTVSAPSAGSNDSRGAEVSILMVPVFLLETSPVAVLVALISTP